MAESGRAAKQHLRIIWRTEDGRAAKQQIRNTKQIIGGEPNSDETPTRINIV